MSLEVLILCILSPNGAMVTRITRNDKTLGSIPSSGMRITFFSFFFFFFFLISTFFPLGEESYSDNRKRETGRVD